jgi:hypothetical protein
MWTKRAGLITLAALLVVGAQNASAQSSSGQVAAEGLFKQGRDLMASGRYAEACPKLVESQRLDPAPGTLLNLATCYEKNGQIASAWVTYKEAASAAQNAEQQERARLARRKAAELEPKLPTLTIVVPPAADRADLQVRRDGEIIGRPGWGTAIPVDPGPHSVDVAASGRVSWHGQVSVEGPGSQASIEVVPLEVQSDQAAGSTVSTGGTSTGSAPMALPPAGGEQAPTPPAGSPGSGQRTAAFVVGGVAIATLATGSIFGLVAKSNNDDAKGHCPADNACDSQGVSLTKDAQHAATASTIAFVGGGVLVAAGLVLYFTAPKDAGHAATSVGISPLIGAGSGGIMLGGPW